MAYFYLVASLPSLDLEGRPPFAASEFRFRCQGVLSSEDLRELDAVLRGRPDEGQSVFARTWNSLDTQLRNAVARQRAIALNVDATPYLREHPGFSTFAEKTVGDALARPNPLEQELALDRFRWYLLGQLVLDEAFGLPAVLAFAARLRLVERWSALTPEAGRRRFEELVTANLAKEGYALDFDVWVD